MFEGVYRRHLNTPLALQICILLSYNLYLIVSISCYSVKKKTNRSTGGTSVAPSPNGPQFFIYNFILKANILFIIINF